jgi:hypothetical protein
MVISSETTASKEELTAHRSNKHPKLRIVRDLNIQMEMLLTNNGQCLAALVQQEDAVILSVA